MDKIELPLSPDLMPREYKPEAMTNEFIDNHLNEGFKEHIQRVLNLAKDKANFIWLYLRNEDCGVRELSFGFDTLNMHYFGSIYEETHADKKLYGIAVNRQYVDNGELITEALNNVFYSKDDVREEFVNVQEILGSISKSN